MIEIDELSTDVGHSARRVWIIRASGPKIWDLRHKNIWFLGIISIVSPLLNAGECHVGFIDSWNVKQMKKCEGGMQGFETH